MTIKREKVQSLSEWLDMNQKQKLDSLNLWLAEWEPYFESVKAYSSDPAWVEDLEQQFAKLRRIQAREATKRKGN